MKLCLLVGHDYRDALLVWKSDHYEAYCQRCGHIESDGELLSARAIVALVLVTCALLGGFVVFFVVLALHARTPRTIGLALVSVSLVSSVAASLVTRWRVERETRARALDEAREETMREKRKERAWR